MVRAAAVVRPVVVTAGEIRPVEGPALVEHYAEHKVHHDGTHHAAHCGQEGRDRLGRRGGGGGGGGGYRPTQLIGPSYALVPTDPSHPTDNATSMPTTSPHPTHPAPHSPHSTPHASPLTRPPPHTHLARGVERAARQQRLGHFLCGKAKEEHHEYVWVRECTKGGVGVSEKAWRDAPSSFTLLRDTRDYATPHHASPRLTHQHHAPFTMK